MRPSQLFGLTDPKKGVGRSCCPTVFSTQDLSSYPIPDTIKVINLDYTRISGEELEELHRDLDVVAYG